MFTYTVERQGHRNQNYIGFTRYNPSQLIPVRDHVDTWLCSADANGETEIWVVQVAPSMNGFSELARYYENNYAWGDVPCHIIRIDKTEQRMVTIHNDSSCSRMDVTRFLG